MVGCESNNNNDTCVEKRSTMSLKFFKHSNPIVNIVGDTYLII